MCTAVTNELSYRNLVRITAVKSFIAQVEIFFPLKLNQQDFNADFHILDKFYKTFLKNNLH